MWNLPDESTSFLVQRFYAHLLQDPNRPTAGEALHLAMVETSKRWNDPIFWAAFQVVGGY